MTVSDVTDPAGAVVLETAGGAPLGQLLGASRLPAADPRRTRAVLVGGWGGTGVPAAALDAPFGVDGLAPWGAAPGAGLSPFFGAGGASGSGPKAPRRRGAQLAPVASVSTDRASSFNAPNSSAKEASTLSGFSVHRA